MVASGAMLMANDPGVRSNQDALGSHGQRIPMSSAITEHFCTTRDPVRSYVLISTNNRAQTVCEENTSTNKKQRA
jgi:hypothetical protein